MKDGNVDEYFSKSSEEWFSLKVVGESSNSSEFKSLKNFKLCKQYHQESEKRELLEDGRGIGWGDHFLPY